MIDKVNIADKDIRDAFFDELYNLAAKDRNVIFLTADMGALALERLKRDLPGQYINVGISEQNLVSVAAGMALSGKKIFIYAIAPFITQRCYEQVRIDICQMELPVTLIGSGPGISYSSDGSTHHAVEDIAIMRVLPNLSILNPSDAIAASAAAKIAYRNDNPVYIRLEKGRLTAIYKENTDFSAGMFLIREGHNVLLVTTGIMVHTALATADMLAKQNISCAVIDIFQITPFNQDVFLTIIKDKDLVVILEEHSVIGGLGTIVAEIFADHGISILLRRIGITEKSTDKYGDRAWMHRYFKLDVETVAQEIKRFSQQSKIASIHACPYQKLTVEDFAFLFGTTSDDVEQNCGKLLKSFDFRYKTLLEDEYEQAVLDSLKKIDSGTLSVAGKGKKEKWEEGWSENAENFLRKDYDFDELIPKYYRPNQILRIMGKIAKGIDSWFEYNFFQVLRQWLYNKYFRDARYVYEFGCGPGHNLVALATLFPDKKIYGLDWTHSSVEIVSKLSEVFKFKISACLFDMFSPDYSLEIEKDSIVMTMGALEQLGNNYEEFLQFVLRKKPLLCVNVEPLCELYDQNNLLDYLAFRHHKARNLLGDYLQSLRKKESERVLEIMKIQRVRVGCLLEEGWSYIIWKPVSSK